MEDLNIYRYLADRINESGIKQKDLAVKLGVTPSLISKIKTEQIPSDRLLCDLSKILGWGKDQEQKAMSLAGIAREINRKRRELVKNNPKAIPTQQFTIQPRLVRELQKLKRLFEEVRQSQARIEGLLEKMKEE